MLQHLMTSWHLNTWKFKTWLSQEQKELLVLKIEEILKWRKKTYFVSQVLSFRKMKQPSKKVEKTTFKHEIVALECLYDKPETHLGSEPERINLSQVSINPIQNGLFRGCSCMGGGEKSPNP